MSDDSSDCIADVSDDGVYFLHSGSGRVMTWSEAQDIWSRERRYALLRKYEGCTAIRKVGQGYLYRVPQEKK